MLFSGQWAVDLVRSPTTRARTPSACSFAVRVPLVRWTRGGCPSRLLLQAGNVIRSNGLTTVRYNELSHALGRREDLRERVQRQAQLYRIQATGADGAEPAVPLEREQRPSDEAPRSRRRDGIEERRGDKRKRKPKPKSKQVSLSPISSGFMCRQSKGQPFWEPEC